MIWEAMTKHVSNIFDVLFPNRKRPITTQSCNSQITVEWACGSMATNTQFATPAYICTATVRCSCYYFWVKIYMCTLSSHHCTSDVCVTVLCQHWVEWLRAACSVRGHHQSQCWYIVNRIPDWILRFLNKAQQSSYKNALKCRLQNGGLSVAASMSYCHELQHKGIRVWSLNHPQVAFQVHLITTRNTVTDVSEPYVDGGVFDFTIKINFADGDSDGWIKVIGLNFDAHVITVSLLYWYM